MHAAHFSSTCFSTELQQLDSVNRFVMLSSYVLITPHINLLNFKAVSFLGPEQSSGQLNVIVQLG